MLRVEATPQFRKWIDALPDVIGRARILVRIDRLIHGNPGHYRSLGDGLFELKVDSGPGYRVYYTLKANQVLLLLAGGDKSSQSRDVANAIRLARAFRE